MRGDGAGFCSMRRVTATLAMGCAAIAALWLVGFAWPQSQGHRNLTEWLKDRMADDASSRFDRQRLMADLGAAGLALGDGAHVRIFKREAVLELWMQRDGGRYALFRSYPICKFSGGLGPKLQEGDHQAPEGFYRVAKAQLNPASRHHLAFNLGFPNAFDRQLARNGSALMVHGGCSSIGCYAMTDVGIDEIYAVVEAALDKGQDEVDVSIFPFRLSEAALAAEAGSSWLPFWRNLKRGADLFETNGMPPRVGACRGEYRFGDEVSAPDCAPITGWV